MLNLGLSDLRLSRDSENSRAHLQERDPSPFSHDAQVLEQLLSRAWERTGSGCLEDRYCFPLWLVIPVWFTPWVFGDSGTFGHQEAVSVA